MNLEGGAQGARMQQDLQHRRIRRGAAQIDPLGGARSGIVLHQALAVGQ